MTLHKLPRTLIMLLLLLPLALPFSSQAQSTEVQFTTVDIDDKLTISLPQDWLVWRRADHASDEEADQAAVSMIRGVNAGISLGQPFISPWDRLIAVPPTPIEGGLVRLSVETEQIDALAGRAGLIPRNVTAARLLELAGAELVDTVDTNGRYTAFGRVAETQEPALVSSYVFQGLNQTAVVSVLAPAEWLTANIDLVTTLLVSLRLPGEPVDVDAYEVLANAAFPESFVLPPDSIASETVVAASEAPVLVCGNIPSEIAFTSNRDGDHEIYLVGENGADPRRLTNSPGIDVASGWSPDGSRLYFHSDRNGSMDIFSMNADGSDVRQLTTTSQDELAASVSPDGTRIAFHRTYEPGQSDIFVLDLATGEEQQLTTVSGAEQWPSWSPDGSRIAFNGDFAGALDIYVMNADGSKVTRLTRDTAPDGPPLWSPDSAQIVFWAEREHDLSEAYLMNADGSDVRQLTYNETTDFVASWSPDGRFIALQSARDGNSDIYLLGLNDHRFLRLTDHEADDIDPRWRPCAANG